MDDTIEYLGKAWVDYLNNRHGTSVRHSDLRFWDVSIAFPELTNNQVYAPLYEDDFWKTVKPIPGAAEVLEKLMKDGHRVFIVTASSWQTLPSKIKNVLFRYFPFVTWDQVIVTNNKQIISGDVLVDDAPHNLVNGDYIRILMDAPHNWDFDESTIDAVRFKNWNDIYDHITLISKVLEGI